MSTIKDVAKQAGVSVATVSRVINGTDSVSEATTRKVREAINTLGFQLDYLAQSWRTGVTRTIAAVLLDNTSPHHGVALREAGNIARKHNHSLLLCTTYFDPQIEKQYLQMLRARRVDGVLLNNTGDCSTEIQQLNADGVPVVMLNRPLNRHGPLVDAVLVDSYQGSFDIVQHLIRVGHRRIAMIYDSSLHDFHQRERVRGYRDALLANGISFNKQLVRGTRLIYDEGIGMPAQDLAFSPRPTALYAAGYGVGVASLGVLRAQKLLIPEDIAFAMFDEANWGAFVDPPLTAVRNPAEEMGRVAAELLFDRLTNPNRPPQEIRLKPTLIVRRSCGWPGILSSANHNASQTRRQKTTTNKVRSTPNRTPSTRR